MELEKRGLRARLGSDEELAETEALWDQYDLAPASLDGCISVSLLIMLVFQQILRCQALPCPRIFASAAAAVLEALTQTPVLPHGGSLSFKA